MFDKRLHEKQKGFCLKGVKLRLVRPLVEHSSRTHQSILADMVNTDNLLELPTSNYFLPGKLTKLMHTFPFSLSRFQGDSAQGLPLEVKLRVENFQ